MDKQNSMFIITCRSSENMFVTLPAFREHTAVPPAAAPAVRWKLHGDPVAFRSERSTE